LIEHALKLRSLAIAAGDLFAKERMRSGVAMVASTASQLQISWRATFTWMMPI
jgi:hypothetical protein